MRTAIIALLAIANLVWAEDSDSLPLQSVPDLLSIPLDFERTHVDPLRRVDYEKIAVLKTNTFGEFEFHILEIEDKTWMVRDPGHVNYSNETFYCKFHQAELQEDVIDIFYGIDQRTKGYEDLREAEKYGFPNAHTADYSGGYLLWDHSPPKRKVLYCEICRKKKKEWEANREIEATNKGPRAQQSAPEDATKRTASGP